MTKILETTFSESPQVDRAAGVIKNVKILGSHSRNGREYSPQAQRDAAKIYEGLGINLNHPDRKESMVDRPVQDGFGWLEGVEVKPDGVYGNLHYLKSHPQAEMIAEAAERNPNRFGLSHNAEGKMSRQGGKNVVESIESVRSVDIVQNPATNKGFFESQEEPVKKTVKQILESQSGKRITFFKKLFEDGAMLPMGDAPVDVPDEATPEEQTSDAIDALVLSVIHDDSLDAAGKSAKIRKILGIVDDPAPAADATDTTDTGDSAMPESKKPAKSTDPAVIALQEELKSMRKEKTDAEAKALLESSVRKLLESANVEPTNVRIAAVASVSEADRKALVESFSKKLPPRPGRSAPLYESSGSEPVKFPSDSKGFVAALR